MLASLVTAVACGRSSFPDLGSPLSEIVTAPVPDETPPIPTPTTMVLVLETFGGGSAAMQAETDPTWNDTDSATSFEVYTASGAGARGMSSAYDRDLDAGTANVAIPGGLEVNNSGSNILLTATFTMPTPPPNRSFAGGMLRLWVGNRGNPAGTQSIEVFDLTSAATLSGVFLPTLPTGATPRPWVYNTAAVPFASSTAGHTIQLRFQSRGNGGEGLELADIELIANIP